MLHGAKGPGSGDGSPHGRFIGHLFVGGPFGVDFRVCTGELGNFGAGGSRVAGDHPAPRLVQPLGNRLVAQHQLFHSIHPFSALGAKKPTSRPHRGTVEVSVTAHGTTRIAASKHRPFAGYWHIPPQITAGIPSGPTGKSRSAQLLGRELRRPARRPVFSFPGLSVDAHWMATFLRQRIFYIGDIIDDAGEVVNWFFVGECLNSTVFAVSKTSHRDVFDG